ncbi:MAG: hypothetical protein H0V71_09945 [Chloroflexi bacterium]|nr:hypothetical protein [Chloroflexota bacterium]MDQ3401296.1 hypothetical protein [Chloroflexota bacterium]
MPRWIPTSPRGEPMTPLAKDFAVVFVYVKDIEVADPDGHRIQLFAKSV